jgi:replicative DNA helicase
MNFEDIEATIVRGFLQDRQLITMALNEGFGVDLFRTPLAIRLGRVIMDLYTSRGAAIDPLTVRNALESLGSLSDEIGRYLNAVAVLRPPDAGRLMAYVESLKNRDSRDRLQALQEQIGGFLGGAERRAGDMVEFTTKAINDLMELQKRRVRTRIRPVSEVLARIAQDAEERGGNGGLLGYSMSPFDHLTQALSGLRRGFYYGIAGAPRRGKTNLTLQIATYIAANHHIPVLFYSWEQASRVLTARLIAKEIGVDPATILTGGSVDGRPVASLIHGARERMAQYTPYLFLIEAGREDTLGRIRAHAYNIMQEFRTNEIVVFLDYLQKIPLVDHIEEVKARTDLVSSELAELSLELNIPVVAISPLDKDGCRLDEKPVEEEDVFSPFERPTMHHSVGSGDLEYDLDVALVLSKDWRATSELTQLLETQARASGADPESLPKIDIVNLFIDKNRDAPESASYIVQYAFFVTLNRFIELDFKLEKEYNREFRAFGKTQTILNHVRESGFLRLNGQPVGAASKVP